MRIHEALLPPPFFPIGQELHNLLENLIGDADGLGLSD